MRSMGFMMIKTCWFLCIRPVGSFIIARQKYCTQPCLPRNVDGRPSGRPSLNGNVCTPGCRIRTRPPATLPLMVLPTSVNVSITYELSLAASCGYAMKLPLVMSVHMHAEHERLRTAARGRPVAQQPHTKVDVVLAVVVRRPRSRLGKAHYTLANNVEIETCVKSRKQMRLIPCYVSGMRPALHMIDLLRDS